MKRVPLTSLAVVLAISMTVVRFRCVPPIVPVDLITPSVIDAAQLIQTGQITSEELTLAYIEQAEELEYLNAFITLDREGVLAAARQADTELAAGSIRGPLHGVPLVMKDNIHVAGLPNTAGTPGLKDFVPTENAPVVQSLLDASAIILGKANMHELAFGISGYNEAFYQKKPIGVRNPYDPRRFAGGSSSGTGAAVGGGAAPGGLGTDTGGSVRIPSALNGIAGLRPTVGRYSQEGITPISHTRDTAGPMARSVADLALLDAVITGERPVLKAVDLADVRLGVNEYFFTALDDDTRVVIDRALERLAEAGATIVEVDMPGLEDLIEASSFPITIYEAYDSLAAYLETYVRGFTPENIAAQVASRDVKVTYDRAVIPRKLPSPDGLVEASPVYDHAITVARPALQKLYVDTFVNYGIDALIFPTTQRVAERQRRAASALETFSLFVHNTDPGSTAGIPGLSIPAGLGPSGLPVGIAIDGPAGSDRNLLAIGLAIEQVLQPMPPQKNDINSDTGGAMGLWTNVSSSRPVLCWMQRRECTTLEDRTTKLWRRKTPGMRVELSTKSRSNSLECRMEVLSYESFDSV